MVWLFAEICFVRGLFDTQLIERYDMFSGDIEVGD